MLRRKKLQFLNRISTYLHKNHEVMITFKLSKSIYLIHSIGISDVKKHCKWDIKRYKENKIEGDRIYFRNCYMKAPKKTLIQLRKCKCTFH